MSKKNGSLVLGIDLGGTKILSAVANENGGILATNYCRTPASQGPEAVINAMFESSKSVLTKAGIEMEELAAVGIGAPGSVCPHLSCPSPLACRACRRKL